MFIVIMIKLLCKINHKFDCNEKSLVYLIACNKCLKQYVGQTVGMFRSQWNSYKNNSRNLIEEKTLCKGTFTNIFSYQVILVFCKIPVTLIDKTNPRAPTKYEDYWIHILIRQKHLWDLMLKVATKLLSCIVIV